MKTIEQLVEAVEEAQETLTDEIFRQIEAILKREKIDHAVFCMYGDEYVRGNESIELSEIDYLVDLYCENVHSGGFQACWYKNRGWD